MRRRSGRNAAALFLERGVQAVVLGGTSVALARVLGVRDLGVLVTATSLVAILLSVSDFGQSYALSKISLLPAEAAIAKTRQLFALVYVSGAVGAAILLALSALPVFTPGSATSLRVASISLVLHPVYVHDYLRQTDGRVYRGAFGRSMGLLASASWRVGTAALGWSIPVIAAGVIVEQIVAGAFLWNRRIGLARGIRTTEFKQLAKTVYPFFAATCTVTIYNRIDQPLVSVISGADELGQYAVAVAVTQSAFFISPALQVVLNPVLARTAVRSGEAFARAVSALTGILALAGWLMAIGGAVLFPWLTGFAFGASFEHAQSIEMVLIFSYPLVFVAMTQTSWSVAHGKDGLLAKRAGLSLGFVLLANLILVPFWGAMGAAAATVGSHAAAGIVGNLLLREGRPLGKLQAQALCGLHLIADLRWAARALRR